MNATLQRHAVALCLAVAVAVAAPAAAAQVPSTIRIEIDYMEAEDHDHRPPDEVLDAVVQMFACHGISLQIVLSEGIPEVVSMECPTLAENFWTCSGPDAFADLKATYADEGNALGWHYCIFGHRYDDGGLFGSSGYAEGHDDFIVTLGEFEDHGTPLQLAGTLAHELGHNLGLLHSSPASAGVSGPFAPNYVSVMSYRYQLVGVRTGMEAFDLLSSAHLFKDIDYSNGRLPVLDEASLYEPNGVGIRGVNWDCSASGVSGTVTKDLDESRSWCFEGADDSQLDDWDDWANLQDTSGLPAPLAPPASGSQPCISRSEYDALLESYPQLRPGGVASLAEGLSVEPCRNGRMIFVEQGATGTLGTGDAPFGSVTQALAAAPAHSVIYLLGGTYGRGGSLVIDQSVVLAGPTSAVIDP